jgi:hypothetical protein
MLAESCSLLVEAKRDSPDMLSSLPEAIGQALVWRQRKKYVCASSHLPLLTLLKAGRGSFLPNKWAIMGFLSLEV